MLNPTGTPYTEKVDVYSFGTVLWEMLTKDIPFRGVEDPRALVTRGQHPPLPPECPEFFRKLLLRCWETNPSRRPSFDQILVYLSQYQSRNLLALYDLYGTVREIIFVLILAR